ncbi:MAG: 3-demethylubiquinone-9 3-O-methyltransferase, partial [Bacteriovoracaceae bacterium]|nr:3-demethylubiquinone-9 3-O-methyltransferase [Bacteriovoracaceae bacterium]
MKSQAINNDFYNTLGEDWYTAKNNPIAILREEQKAKNPWILSHINKHFSGAKDLKILDIGCGAGFLTNTLAMEYDQVIGLDASKSSLEVARNHDQTSKVEYLQGDAYNLPFSDQSLDVVCAMDFLEHVENPRTVIKEAARTLKPNGLFFFHTFNRNFLSWLIVIKCMEWFVPNTPDNLHKLDLFIKPSELDLMMDQHGLTSIQWRGLRPSLDLAFLRSFFKREVQ